MKTKTILLLAIIFAINLNAQTPERRWGLGFNVGAEQYNGEYGNGFYKFKPFYGFVGISAARNITEHLDIELNGSLGEIGYFDNSNSFRFSLLQININAKYNFFKYDDVKFRPFVFGGIGYLHFSDKRSDRKFNNMQLPDLGFGVTYKVSPTISVVFKETFIFSDYDNVDYQVEGRKDMYLQHTIGVVFNIGIAKDTDGDGITDRNDNCPEVVGIEAFNGCPDTDGDGIIDSEDKCPKVKGLKEFNGCPDTDGDGIADTEDKCPKVKGLKEFNGCPDTDGDGIVDSEDNCPKIKGLKEFNGCPDTDGDGIIDSEDNCPNTKGLEKLQGCPDKDNDGVADKDDICPDVAGLIKNKGCPEVKKEEKKILEKALHGVKFQSGKDVITNSSFPILDNVVSLLEKNPSYKLKIEGHTDSQGDDNMNLELSKKRAKAVKQYIVNKGIKENRLSSEGYGETKPVADNNTSKGRSENRRVELTIEF